MEILNLGGSQEPSARPSKKKFKVVLGIGLLAGVMGIGSTLAATVQINTGATVEFGQGVASTTACDSDITVTPGTLYVNDTQTSGSSANFQMRSITISALNTTTKSSDGGTEGCGGDWLILKAYTTSDSLATNYAQGGSSANALYLGWNYTPPTVNGGVAGTGFVRYNAGISLAIAAGGATCTAKVLTGTNGAADAAGATCAMSGADTTSMTATVTLGKTSSTFGARYGVIAGAVQKITVETSGTDPGYASTTVTS
ncbi:unannotated protein [freshwater metagenome]|uniref:Unannotated protein n=2 Tax=freshwater metagenome TaxID=449393 RepID=A0A6J6FWZ9_9ZZZZ|nr:hypothetical protein [Actinomycetota bacterium]MSV70813.1 hypothetical protein [Actinomycetota bacterium]MSW13313.1 hypothetical protein [Actinomycetota bacterium]MSX47072.1 hypothetical protein [Actinomycetota bacterium]MSX91000.1 hypothetical protein [Actinomycetota bacterium]